MFRDKKFSVAWFKNYYLLVLGASISAFGYALFLIPNKIIPGGLFGITTTLYYLFDLPPGTMAIAMNIPLLIIGVKILGPRFGMKTVLGMSLISILTDLFTFLGHNRALSHDMITSTLVGSFLVGFGVSLIFKAKATTGGTDIVGQILYKKHHIPVGKTMLLLNVFIIGFGGIALWYNKEGIDLFSLYVYAFMGTYVANKVIDVSLEGLSYYKSLFIISNQYEEIKLFITETLHRGGTRIPGKGLFNDDNRQIIFTTLNRRETSIIKSTIKKIDPQAFVVVFQTSEIFGQGFMPLDDKE
ncbi:YitT family protein [bacterium]|nr:YitT family protein [bacterium]